MYTYDASGGVNSTQKTFDKEFFRDNNCFCCNKKAHSSYAFPDKPKDRDSDSNKH